MVKHLIFDWSSPNVTFITWALYFNDTTLKTGVVPFCHSGIFLRLNGFDLSMQIMNKNSAYPLQVNTRYR